MPTPNHDDTYLAEQAMIELLQAHPPLASLSYVRHSDRETIGGPDRLSVRAETVEIPGADVFEITYEILLMVKDFTDTQRRSLTNEINAYLRSLYGQAIWFDTLECELHSPTLGKPQDSFLRDDSDDTATVSLMALTCGGRRGVTEAMHLMDME